MSSDTNLEITQADLALAEEWRFIECMRCSEYTGDFVNDLAADFARHRTTSLAAQDGLVEAVKRFMPTNINLANKNVDDREIIPLDVTFGELRAIDAALASIEVKS